MKIMINGLIEDMQKQETTLCQTITVEITKTKMNGERKKCATTHTMLESNINTLNNIESDINILYHFLTMA